MSLYYCHLSPEVFDRVQVRWTLWMIRKTNVICLEEILWPTRAVWIAVLSCRKIQSYPHRWALSGKSDDRSNMPRCPVAFWHPCLTCSSIVPRYEFAPRTTIEPHPLWRRKSPVGYPCHANTAENYQGHQD